MEGIRNIRGTLENYIGEGWKETVKLKLGQNITLPRIGGEFTRRRKAKVVGIFKYFYLVETEHGYKECILKSYMNGVRV